MCEYSSSVSLPHLSRTLSRMPILPISCKFAAYFMTSISSSARRISRQIASERRFTSHGLFRCGKEQLFHSRLRRSIAADDNLNFLMQLQQAPGHRLPGGRFNHPAAQGVQGIAAAFHNAPAAAPVTRVHTQDHPRRSYQFFSSLPQGDEKSLFLLLGCRSCFCRCWFRSSWSFLSNLSCMSLGSGSGFGWGFG